MVWGGLVWRLVPIWGWFVMLGFYFRCLHCSFWPFNEKAEETTCLHPFLKPIPVSVLNPCESSVHVYPVLHFIPPVHKKGIPLKDKVLRFMSAPSCDPSQAEALRTGHLQIHE